MAKKTLTATTPVGTFTRTTGGDYTAIVVWESPRLAGDIERQTAKGRLSGLAARAVKDHGYGVTWHSTWDLAEKAAAAGYGWDGSAIKVGIFIVDDPAGIEPAPAPPAPERHQDHICVDELAAQINQSAYEITNAWKEHRLGCGALRGDLAQVAAIISDLAEILTSDPAGYDKNRGELRATLGNL